MSDLNESLYQLLLKCDTPTVCNAIEVAQGCRGFANFSKTTVYIGDIKLQPLVGFARTAKIRAQKASELEPAAVRQIRMDYYRYMSEGVRPGICVIQDIDYPNCVGSFWGEINNYSHRAFGLSGTLTDGLMRDLDVLAPNYQVIAGGVGPSHGFVHVLDFDQPVELFGMTIVPGALIHADRHGAVVIPDEIVPKLETAINTLIESENIMLDPLKNTSRLSFAEFEKLWEKFENART